MSKKQHPLRLYNTLTRQLDPVRDADAAHPITLYSCGPTVYNFAHIGNLKTFIFYDTLKRTLLYLGYPVRHAMNLTDIEDKIIARMVKEGKGREEITEPCVAAFQEDLHALNCLPADALPRATEFVPQQIAMIEKLLASGHAYERDGSVYFRIAAFPDYGKLARINVEGIREGARVDNDEYDKESPRDFVLWKTAKADEPPDAVWESPWGKGRPGWHLECSVMAHDILGQPIDIHCGGVDLVFPHHSNELAQSEAAYPEGKDKPFTRLWVHGEHLMVDGGKMSKSLGNVYTRRDLLTMGTDIEGRKDLQAKGIDPQVLRFFFVSNHYRMPLNFTFEAVGSAKAGLERLRTLQGRLAQFPAAAGSVPAELTRLRLEFKTALADDLDFPGALARLHEFVTLANKQLDGGQWGATEAAAVLEFLNSDFSAVFGIALATEIVVPAEIQSLFDQRQAARAGKNFAEADRCRKELDVAGWLIEDGKAGSRLKRRA